MEFISIGPYCSAGDILRDNGFKKMSYPFDYIFSSLEMIKHCINDRFKTFLDQSYYKYCSETSTQHLFYSKFIDTEILRRHHIYCGQIHIANDLTNREVFVHHNLSNSDIYSAYVRRCNRLLDLIDNNSKIVFVYYNFYTTDFDDLIEFYNSFSNNTNIFVVGIFENTSGDKKMLFESSNCKIYQNYDRKDIFDEISTTF
jgi:hypothetical protein